MWSQHDDVVAEAAEIVERKQRAETRLELRAMPDFDAASVVVLQEITGAGGIVQRDHVAASRGHRARKRRVQCQERGHLA